MKKIKSIILFVTSFLILTSCGSLSDAGKILRNEKISNTDEFLVKKKEPLTQPPDFDILPKPGSENSKNEKTENDLTEILKFPSEEKVGQKQKSSSTEESILKKIK